jgi:para-aminobenzoate synthetase component I
MPSLKLYCQPLAPHLANPNIWLKAAQAPYSVYLDSSAVCGEDNTYSILAIDPLEVCDDYQTWRGKRDPLDQEVDSPLMLPFYGGWMGYISYEAYWHFIPQVSPRQTRFPVMGMGFYDTFILINHRAGTRLIASLGLKDAKDSSSERIAQEKIHTFQIKLERMAQDLVTDETPMMVRDSQAPRSSVTRERYQKDIETIQSYIQAGDCYQVNYAQSFELKSPYQASTLYHRLRKASPSRYASFMHWGDFQILSSSPELYLKVQENLIRTEPIKGTVRRGTHELDDYALKNKLLNSEKDKSELLMITDLERNDLGRICQAGTVATRSLTKHMQLPHVHHLYSVIEGHLKDDVGVHDILAACFPGGSISGTPKIRAMQIIRELETHSREVYTGTIGYIGFNKSLCMNIAIRTMIYQRGQVTYWAGGGITIDSDAEAEYEECLVKAKGMRAALS